MLVRASAMLLVLHPRRMLDLGPVAGLDVARCRRSRAGLSFHHRQRPRGDCRRSGQGRHVRDFRVAARRFPQRGLWLVCIRTQNFPLLPRYYAVFLQTRRIVDLRLSVLIDQCELQTYSPFDWIADANAPPVR